MLFDAEHLRRALPGEAIDMLLHVMTARKMPDKARAAAIPDPVT